MPETGTHVGGDDGAGLRGGNRMGYVGDDVMKDWIQINYHTGSGKYADALAGAWQVHQDNCTNPPLNDRWYNNQTEPYLLYGTLQVQSQTLKNLPLYIFP